MTNGQSPAGWYQDPTGQGDARYWNGTAWTQSVNRGGVTVNVAIDPSQAQIPPTPGTQVSAPAAPTQTYAPPPEKSSNNNSVLGVIFGVLAVLLVIVLIYAVVSNSDSGDDTPPAPGTDAPAEEPAPEPAEDAPAEDG